VHRRPDLLLLLPETLTPSSYQHLLPSTDAGAVPLGHYPRRARDWVEVPPFVPLPRAVTHEDLAKWYRRRTEDMERAGASLQSVMEMATIGKRPPSLDSSCSVWRARLFCCYVTPLATATPDSPCLCAGLGRSLPSEAGGVEASKLQDYCGDKPEALALLELRYVISTELTLTLKCAEGF
jgi:hypothetical protein